MLFALQLFAETDKQAETILKSLFPGIDTVRIANYWGSGSSKTIYAPLALRGRKGFIPADKIMSANLNDTITAVFFEIYLHETALSTKQIVNRSVESPDGSLKLLQLVFYNRAANHFVAKPDGFPMESSEWTCLGDVCGTIAVESITAADGSEPIAVAKFTRGLDQSYTQAFWFQSQGKVAQSKALRSGDMSGQTGCCIETRYDEYSVQNGALYATKKTLCDSACAAICARAELPVGTHAEPIVIIPGESK